MSVHPRIAIIDDHAMSRETYAASAASAGYSPCLFDQRYGSVEDLLEKARECRVRFALCDHRLTEGHYARFNGASAVARFYDARIPAVLVTAYQRSDVDTTIRPYRRKIPRLLSSVSPRLLSDALEACRLEVVEQRPPLDRVGCRAVMTVKESVPKACETIVKVRITQWSTTELAGFPLSMVPTSLRDKIAVGAFLFASVNTGANSADDLFFEDFELPHPDDIKAIHAQFGGH